MDDSFLEIIITSYYKDYYLAERPSSIRLLDYDPIWVLHIETSTPRVYSIKRNKPRINY